jgi:hypothetical protein
MNNHCRRLAILAACLAAASTLPIAHASDHLDTPTVIADPAADIGDLYAWTAADGQRLNLVLDVVGKKFSDRVVYAFHIDSGKRVGATTATATVACRFDAAQRAQCWAGDESRVSGDVSEPDGIESRDRRLRVFAGLRDDPFFNNVEGIRAGYDAAAQALANGVGKDMAGCPAFDTATSREILSRGSHTDGGPAKNFLAGWATAALVVSVDLELVNRGGPLLGVWAATYAANDAGSDDRATPPTLDAPIDRAGRPLTGNAMIGPLDPEQDSDRRKEQYNRATPATASSFVADIQRTLGLYDGFDGVCGNQWLADGKSQAQTRYLALAKLLADDRLWVDSAATRCTRLFAVELAGDAGKHADCGGRAPSYDAVDTFRSMLVDGTGTGAGDGVDRDDGTHSDAVFPFLAAP